MTARERLLEFLERERGGFLVDDLVGRTTRLALEAAEEMCDARNDWRWWREQDPTGGGFEDSAHACGQLAAAIRALRDEVSK